MANQYYYTVSSLPMLMWDSDKFMTESEFLYACESTVAEKDFETLKAALLIPVQGAAVTNPVLKSWYDWENTLRSELVKLRAAKKGTDNSPYCCCFQQKAIIVCGKHLGFSRNTPHQSQS